MPLDFCHPEAPHKKLRMPEWYVSSLMMDRALDAVVRRVKHLDREHDIPYLAGYSLDGSTIYFDRHMPQSFKFRGRVIETDRFLLLHEEVEKTLIDRLGLHYLHAHQIATRAEQAAVRAAGISWRAYDRFMQKNVKRDSDERLSKVPADLDTKPYRDEHDFDLLRRMIQGLNWRRANPYILPSARRGSSISANRLKTPAYSSIRIILRQLDVASVEQVFRRHSAVLHERSAPQRQCHVAVDGKALRLSFDNFQDRKAAHMLSAFASDTALVLAHLDCDEKSNEIPAVQALLRQLGLDRVLLTADAMHCQKKLSKRPRRPVRS
jgi:hypothetical protein